MRRRRGRRDPRFRSGYCSSAPASLTPPRETKGCAGCAWITASAAMPSDGFCTCLSLAMTRPASIAACARARLSNRPRSTSSMSARLRGGGVLGLAKVNSMPARRGAEPFGGHAHAGLECGQVVPEVGGRLPWRHQRAAVQIERMNHHQIVGQSEILDGQAVRIDQAAILRVHCGEFAHAVGVERRIVAIAEAEFSASRHDSRVRRRCRHPRPVRETA